MKTLKNLFIISLLCLLPATTVYAQLSEVTKQMPQVETISINNADADMLAKLPGIGKKKSQAIVDYREENGEFKSVSDLSQVKGIGKKLLAKLEGKISL
ncbi:helix-hairpin-helix domain-containing protein [Pseudoalteromonas sp. NSLLW24]|uniref:ComEA family DNA-binding protein n=1 Tax=Pseudoalteromonas sp. NSLLW24 TaxID=2792050 RepID=UPI0018CCCA14|nr:helix-hairpin-helix domain-containing protein [Pseudoalteromonas sp. NSLLW24]MBG9997854.1 helix-hairpin-helix domain-containing protein [Pseudoalteromonas sp. NSLLW24]